MCRQPDARVNESGGANYLEKLGSLAPGTARRVVDKMPDNFRLIGLITLLWPSARVIVCGARRRPYRPRAGKPGLESKRTPWTNDWEEYRAASRRFSADDEPLATDPALSLPSHFLLNNL